MRTREWVAASAMCLVMACGSSAEPTSPSTSTSPSPSPSPSTSTSTSPSPSPSTSPSPSPALPEADVRALVDAWLLAQNDGDFAAYEALYAARFDGIRRSGPRVRRFDRAGWMSDRRSMFSRAMHVEAHDVTVSSVGSLATVRFTQSFRAGTYQDEGPKELTVVREDAGLRIAREEMLASTLAPASAPLAPGALMPIVTAASQRFAVIAPVPDGADWHEGAPRLVTRDVVVVTRARARTSAVPAELAAVAGQSVLLADEHGNHCDARLGELAVLSRVDVHFSVEQAWDGTRDDGSQGTPTPPAEIARDAWGEGMLLVAPLDDATVCPEASFARLASLPTAPVFAESDADAALTTRALAAFRALPVWAAIEQELRDAGGDRAQWDVAEGAGPSVAVWQAPNTTRRFVVVGADASDGGCADFSAALWAVFEVGADGALTPLTDASTPGSFVPLGAVDVDGDGRPEWVVTGGVVGAVGAGLGLVTDIAPVVHDCYC